jgi:glycine dehydrogenase subunit 1
MNPYLPHTKDDIRQMLSAIGAESINELFTDIPEKVHLQDTLKLPEGVSEYEAYQHMLDLANRNTVPGVSFLGCGSYDHIIPATVDQVISRSEFYTAYTPYQAEISQGILQAIFEFQTLMCELTGMDVSNASLYDGHTAASEAAVVAINSKRRTDTILYSQTIHPSTKAVLKTYFRGTGVQLKEIGQEHGITSRKELQENLGKNVAGVIVQSPNLYGYLEDYTGFADDIHEADGLLIISSNPMSLSVLKSQREWGADIAIGDTQPFGITSYFGGPSVGYIAARDKYLRKMPGRIVGESIDADGKRAFVLTLQAREQHIKRERATSNICSNQALAALASSVYLATVGKHGLKQIGEKNIENSHYLFERIIRETDAEPLYDKPFFNEFTLRTKKPALELVQAVAEEGFFAGVPLSYFFPDLDQNLLTVAVTEKRTREEMDAFIETVKRVGV